jgi:hypothetical protein
MLEKDTRMSPEQFIAKWRGTTRKPLLIVSDMQEILVHTRISRMRSPAACHPAG